MFFSQRTVGRGPGEVEIYELGPAARANMSRDVGYMNHKSPNGYLLEGLSMQFRPVLDGVTHHPAVDVVEWLVVSPLILNVVDFEPDIRRNPVTTMS